MLAVGLLHQQRPKLPSPRKPELLGGAELHGYAQGVGVDPAEGGSAVPFHAVNQQAAQLGLGLAGVVGKAQQAIAIRFEMVEVGFCRRRRLVTNGLCRSISLRIHPIWISFVFYLQLITKTIIVHSESTPLPQPHPILGFLPQS